MEKKLLIQDIAEAIATKSGINKKQSEAFVKALFETIEQGLTEDKFVKIKGLGTFKVIAVGERESVNINTGERFSISGHDKITFTPENSLKDLVNRPFSHFQTVILNEETNIEELESVDNITEESDNQSIEVIPNASEDFDTAKEELDTNNNNSTEQPQSEDEQENDSNELVNNQAVSTLPTEENTKNSQPISPMEQTANTEKGKEGYVESAIHSTDNQNESTSSENIDNNESEQVENKNAEQEQQHQTEETPAKLTSDEKITNIDTVQSEEKEKSLQQTDANPIKEDDAVNNGNDPEKADSMRVDDNKSTKASSEENEVDESDSRSPKKRRNIWKTVTLSLLTILILLLTYFAGYFKIFCPCEFWNNGNTSENIPTIQPIQVDSLSIINYSTVIDTTNNDTTDSISTSQFAREQDASNNIRITTITSGKAQENRQNSTTSTERRDSVTQEVKTKYKQVEGGKYEITGTLRMHKIEKGETIRTIAQDVYGSKGYATYIITYNELANPNLIDTGTVIKLPKLTKRK